MINFVKNYKYIFVLAGLLFFSETILGQTYQIIISQGGPTPPTLSQVGCANAPLITAYCLNGALQAAPVGATYTLSGGIFIPTNSIYQPMQPYSTVPPCGSVSCNLQGGASAGPSSIGSGSSTTLSAWTSGGSGNYSYSWSNGLGSGSPKTASPTSTTTYSVTATDNVTACTVTSSVTVYVTACTAPSSAGSIYTSPSSVTTGNSVSILNSANPSGGSGSYEYLYQYSTSVSGGRTAITGWTTATSASFAPSSAGTYYVWRTVRSSCGSSTVETSATVTVSAPCIAPTSGGSMYTSPTNPTTGSSITIVNSANPSGGSGSYEYLYQYSTSFSGTRTAITGWTTAPSASFTPSSTGTYYVWRSVRSSCGSSSLEIYTTTTVSTPCTAPSSAGSIYTSPSTGTAGSSVSILNSGNPSGGSGGYQYLYQYSTSFSGTKTAITGWTTVTSVSFTPANAGTYYVWRNVRSSCGSSSVVTYATLTVNPSCSPPTANAGPNQTIFQGGSATLNASASGGAGGYTYSWSNGLGSGATKTVSPTVTTTYTVTVTEANGCTDTDQMTVTVSACSFTANTSSDVDICSGDNTTISVTASGSSGYTYSWNNSLGSGATKTVSPTVSTTYTVTVTDVNNCTVTDQVMVTVINNYTDGGTIAADETNCGSFDPALITSTVTASGGNGGSPTYQWQQNTGSGWTNISGATTTTYNPTTITQTTQYRRGVRRDACFSYVYSNTITKTVSATLSNAGTISGDETICTGETANAITSTTAPGGSVEYIWESSTNNGATWTTISSATNTDYTPTTPTTTTQYRRGVRLIGCGSTYTYSNIVTKTVIATSGSSLGINATELQKIVAADSVSNDRFGNSVAISGDYAIVGAYLKDTQKGAAYIYKRNSSNNWVQIKKLTLPGGNILERFGWSVAISGNYAIIGAPYRSSAGKGNSGSAYIFEKDAGGNDNWGQIKELISPNPLIDGYFGLNVVISGDDIVVATRNQGNSVMPFMGSGVAYIYQKNIGGSNNWGLLKEVLPNDIQAQDRFGWSASISGDYLVIGSPYSLASQYGSAYIFQRNTGGSNNWGQVKKIVAPDPDWTDRFGSSASISGNYVIVGTFQKNNSTGAAYIFEKNTGGSNNWGQVKKIVASDGMPSDLFSSSVAISDNYAIAGSSGNGQGGNQAGAVYLFEKNTGGSNNWGEIQKILTNDIKARDNLGHSLFISDNNEEVIISAPSVSDISVWPFIPAGAGAAYIFGIGNGITTLSDTICQGNTYALGGQTFNTAGVYQVTLQDFNGCDSIVELTLTVINQLANGGTIAGNESNCNSFDPANITSTTLPSGGSGGTVTYQWQQNTGSGWLDISNANATTYNPTTITQTTQYRRGAKENNNCSFVYSNTITKTINTAPTANAGTDETICSGSSANLIASGGISYTWSNSLGNTASVTASPTTTTTYTVTVTDANGCTATDQVLVTVNTNFTNGGTIAANQSNCSSFDPANMTQTAAASGGSGGSGGTIQYIWESSINGGTTWTTISGATAATYNPTTITQTTLYRRGARRTPCTAYVYSNTITKTVSLAGCTEICGNGIDDNNDGLIDCQDPDCYLVANSGDTDNDGDGYGDICDLDDDNDGILDTLECTPGFYYVDWSNISGNTGTGTINGINVTYTSSQPINQSASLYNHSHIPTSYNVPNGPIVIKNLQITNNTLTFASPMVNPILVFTSIGRSTINVPIIFGSPVELLWSENVVQDSPIQITGTEGIAIVKMTGTFTTVSFDYTVTENSASFVFGATSNDCPDTDNDGTPDYLDTDSDNDGCSDAAEGSGNLAAAIQNDTLIGGVGTNGVPLVAGTGQGIGSSRDASVIVEYCNPSLSFEKSAIDTAQAGSTIYYTFSITNNAGAILNNVSFTDNLNSGALYYSNPTQMIGGIQVVGTTLMTSTANLTLNNVPIGTSSFQLAISIPNDYTAGTAYCNQAQLNNLSASNNLLPSTKLSDNPNTTAANDATCTIIWRPEICDNGIDDDLDGLDDCNDPDCQLPAAGGIRRGL